MIDKKVKTFIKKGEFDKALNSLPCFPDENRTPYIERGVAKEFVREIVKEMSVGRVKDLEETLEIHKRMHGEKSIKSWMNGFRHARNNLQKCKLPFVDKYHVK